MNFKMFLLKKCDRRDVLLHLLDYVVACRGLQGLAVGCSGLQWGGAENRTKDIAADFITAGLTVYFTFHYLALTVIKPNKKIKFYIYPFFRN